MDDALKELVEEQAYSWLEVHKKSALMYVVLRGLSLRAMWSKQLTDWVVAQTGWSISERGLYRVLQRMERQGVIEFTATGAERTGADRKVYRTTEAGELLLQYLNRELAYLAKLPAQK
jgi:PadR family transcriptional regulator PadR